MSFQVSSREEVRDLRYRRHAPSSLVIRINKQFHPPTRLLSNIFHAGLEELMFKIDFYPGRRNPHPLVDAWFEALRNNARVLDLKTLCLDAFEVYARPNTLNKRFSRFLLTPFFERSLLYLKLSGFFLQKKLCGLLGRTLPSLTILEENKCFSL